MTSTPALPSSGLFGNGNGNAKEKESFKIQAELFAPSRLPTKVYDLYRTRQLVTDILAHECLLLTLTIAKCFCLGNSKDLPRVGIIGGGHIGSAIAMTLLKNEYPVEKIAISTRQADRLPKCEALHTPRDQQLFQNIPRFFDNARISKECDILLLCMPPSQLKSVAIQIKHALQVPEEPTVVISLLCGVTVESLQKCCGTKFVLKTSVDVTKVKSFIDNGMDTSSNEGDEEHQDAIPAFQLAAEELRKCHCVYLPIWWVSNIVHRHYVMFGNIVEAEIKPLFRVLTALSQRLRRQNEVENKSTEASEDVIVHSLFFGANHHVRDPCIGHEVIASQLEVTARGDHPSEATDDWTIMTGGESDLGSQPSSSPLLSSGWVRDWDQHLDELHRVLSLPHISHVLGSSL